MHAELKEQYLQGVHLDLKVLVLLEDLEVLDFQWLLVLQGSLLILVFLALPSYQVVQAIQPCHLFQVDRVFQVIQAFLGSL